MGGRKMPREAKGLTARQVETLGDGKHGDGRGLYLIVRGDYRAWFFHLHKPERPAPRDAARPPAHLLV